MSDRLYPRVLSYLIRDELIGSFPAVMLVGARACGKSTLLSNFADHQLDLAQSGVRDAVASDPEGVLARLKGTILIDEWQEVPEVLWAVKKIVDTDKTNQAGRFLITGSVRARSAGTWAGTGRIIQIRMHGLSQGELDRLLPYNPIDVLFSKDRKFAESDLSRSDYLDRIVRGRFPGIVDAKTTTRDRWLDSYIEQLCDRDAAQIADKTPHPDKLRSILDLSAARTGMILNKQTMASDAEISRPSVDSYTSLLDGLGITINIRPWSTNRISRITKHPKVHITDPGLACHLLNVDTDALSLDGGLVGQLIETFVVTELATHLPSSPNTKMFHLRETKRGNEVDVVLEQKGRIVGLEMKAATSIKTSDWKGLRWLRNEVGDQFHLGAVLYSGKLPYQLDDNIWALPISCLWRPGP